LQYDGEENAGFGLNDLFPASWTDLSGYGQHASRAGRRPEWYENYVSSESSGLYCGAYYTFAAHQALVDAVNSSGWTVQYCGRVRPGASGTIVSAILAVGSATSGLRISSTGGEIHMRYRNVQTSMGATGSLVNNANTFTYDGATLRRYLSSDLSRSSGATLTGQSDTTGTSGILLCGNFYDIATDLFALRVYDRVLDDFDRLVNTRMDEERFLGSNVTWIVGLYAKPQEYGTPTGFGYGVARVDPGYSGFSFDVSGSLEEYSDSHSAYPIDPFTRARCTGIELRTATSCTTNEAVSYALASASADLRATLLWTVEYRYAATARTGGKVRAGGGAATNAVEEWCAPGTVVALTAVADSGYRFVRWTGGVPEGVDAASASIDLPLDMGRAVYATFEET
ncbi:MAG: hypothetical protein GX571_09895, partial [Lentisphaerae bacterium]|nr:hypothetical protein [Lentisphaerota bacterium]